MTDHTEMNDTSEKKFSLKLPFYRVGERSLEARLIGLGNLWGVLLVLIAGVFIWVFTGLLLQNNLSLQATQWLDKMDELGTPLLVLQDPEEFTSIKEHVLKFPEVAYLRYYAEDGKTVLGEYVADTLKIQVAPLSQKTIQRLRQVTPSAAKNVRLPTDNMFHIRTSSTAVIKAHNSDGMLDFSLEKEGQEISQVIGYIDLMLDFSHYRSLFKKSMTFAGVAILLFFIFSTLFGRMIVRKALKPLEDLQVPLEKLSRGETDIEVDSAGPSEIAAVGRALNTTIRAIKERDVALQKMVNFDVLTGLFNRFCFNQLLDSELNRLALTNQTSALFFIDLDQFKYLNDTAGHAAGDRLLIEIAALLKKKVRHEDVVARFGGDEFLVLLKDVSLENAAEVAGHLMTAFQNYTFVDNGKVFHIYCSIGIAAMSSVDSSIEEVISHADIACHEAKLRGRNRYEFFDEGKATRQKMEEDVGWSQRIRAALESDAFQLEFQPVAWLENNNVQHCEALVRMLDGQHEHIPPNAFISAAERFGLAVDLDRWVVKNVVEMLSKYSASTAPVVSINLSGKTVQQPEFVGFVKKITRACGVAPESLLFEINEHVVVNDAENARIFVESIVAQGSGVVIDDFGAVLSVFSTLKSFSITAIKINGTITTHLKDDIIDQAMMNSIVQMAKALGVKTCAKMVEDEETLLLLKGFGVDLAQGFYLGYPTGSLTHGIIVAGDQSVI